MEAYAAALRTERSRMNRYYQDLLNLSPTPPLWFDEHAVPRFCPFAPDEVANIYAAEVVLLGIECQSCETRFEVAMSWSDADLVLRKQRRFSLDVQALHYGDPPNIQCCPAGPTMNSEPKRVLEFWRRDGRFEWTRVPELEVAIEVEW